MSTSKKAKKVQRKPSLKNNTPKYQMGTNDYVYTFCKDFNKDSLYNLYKDFDSFESDQINNLYIILCSNGGLPDCAYEIAHYIRKYAHKVIGLFPTTTYSSSVLVGLSCDELIFGTMGGWGPLDSQTPYYTADLGFQYDSTENIDACYKAIIDYGVKAMDESVRMIQKRTKLNPADSVKLSKYMVDAVVQPVLSKIDPITLGAYHRGSELASMYGVRILKDIMKMNIKNAWDICYDLTKGWPTHDFHIKQNELRSYGLPIKKPSPSILNALDTLKFRLDEAEPFQGFIEGKSLASTMDKIAA